MVSVASCVVDCAGLDVWDFVVVTVVELSVDVKLPSGTTTMTFGTSLVSVVVVIVVVTVTVPEIRSSDGNQGDSETIMQAEKAVLNIAEHLMHREPAPALYRSSPYGMQIVVETLGSSMLCRTRG